MAFANGDIAYILGGNLPIRKSQRPYAGCRVLDGTKSDDDWIGRVRPKDLPRIVNPKKGYIVTANNRQMPENVVNDYGATITSTIRAQRITELIQNGIKAGHKFDYNDMLIIQNDTLDLMARDLSPLVAKIGLQMVDILEP
jgi:penicillin G amidase